MKAMWIIRSSVMFYAVTDTNMIQFENSKETEKCRLLGYGVV
jgi:hypothetical protein